MRGRPSAGRRSAWSLPRSARQSSWSPRPADRRPATAACEHQDQGHRERTHGEHPITRGQRGTGGAPRSALDLRAPQAEPLGRVARPACRVDHADRVPDIVLPRRVCRRAGAGDPGAAPVPAPVAARRGRTEAADPRRQALAAAGVESHSVTRPPLNVSGLMVVLKPVP